MGKLNVKRQSSGAAHKRAAHKSLPVTPRDSGIRTQSPWKVLEWKAGAVTPCLPPQLGSGLAYLHHPEETTEKLNPRGTGYRSNVHNRVDDLALKTRDWVSTCEGQTYQPLSPTSPTAASQPPSDACPTHADQETAPSSEETRWVQRNRAPD